MSKYNLTDILNEYIGGGRIGTLKISYKDLVDKMDELEKSGKVIVREIPGPSGDFKVNREFEVVDRNSPNLGTNKQERGFTVYDYKFGFDPGSEEHFDQEYDFSVGGNDLQLAMDLIDGVKAYGIDDFPNLKENIPPSRDDKMMRDLVKADEIIKMIKMLNPDVRDDLFIRMDRMKKGMDESIIGQKLNEGDLFSSKFSRQDLKDIINDLNKGLILDIPTRRAYKFLTSLLDKQDRKELGLDDVSEQMFIDDKEFEMEMGRSPKTTLKKEMMIHVDQLIDGNMDMEDFIKIVGEIMAELNLREEVEIPGSVLNKIAASVSNPATGARAILDFYKQIQDKENIDLTTNAKFKIAIDKLKDLADDKEVVKEFISKLFGKQSKIYMPKKVNIADMRRYVSMNGIEDLQAKVKDGKVSPKQLAGINNVIMAIEEFLQKEVLKEEDKSIKFLIFPTGGADDGSGLTEDKVKLFITIAQRGKLNKEANPDKTLQVIKTFIEDYLKKQQGLKVGNENASRSFGVTAYDIDVPVTFDEVDVKEVMGIDRKGRKKSDRESNLTGGAVTTMKESSQEESLADYLIKSYTNPNTGKSMVDDRMVSDFMRTVPEWEDIFDGSEEGNDSIDKEFEDFLFLNYDSIDEVKERKEMKQLREHFNRFK